MHAVAEGQDAGVAAAADDLRTLLLERFALDIERASASVEAHVLAEDDRIRLPQAPAHQLVCILRRGWGADSESGHVREPAVYRHRVLGGEAAERPLADPDDERDPELPATHV